MANMTELNRRRGAVKRSVTAIDNFLRAVEQSFNNNKVIDEKSICELQSRLLRLDRARDDFEAVQSLIESTCDDDVLDEQYKNREEFENTYFSLHASISCILSKTKKIFLKSSEAYDSAGERSIFENDGSDDESVRSAVQFRYLKLPTINLPTFNSDINHWLEFKDIFQSLIHLNDRIPDIMKFHYLKTSLKGDSVKLVQSLETCSANYKVAWELLCQRYDNSKLLVQNHLKSLFSLEVITRESSQAIRSLLDSVFKHLRALNSLNEPTQSWDSIIIFMMTSKLDKVTAREWENFKISLENPKLSDLQEFLRTRADFLETFEATHPKKDNFQKNQRVLLSSKVSSCYFCQDPSHFMYRCEQFLKLPVSERIEKAKQLQLCLNCLGKDHNSYNCKSGPCRRCKTKKHNSVLHLERATSEKGEVDSGDQLAKLDSSESSVVLYTTINESVLLSTAVVNIFDSTQDKHSCRIVLDSGSQSNYITHSFTEKLNLKLHRVNLLVTGVNNIQSAIRYKCFIKIESRINNFSRVITCLVLPKITDNIPNSDFDISSWNIPQHVELADPTFNKSTGIDVLIGADIFWETIISNDRLVLSKGKPVLRNSVFGWIVTGVVKQPVGKTICNISQENELQTSLRKFWELEECDIPNPLSPDEKKCEQLFQGTFARDRDGRFIVRLPLRLSPHLLGDSMVMARNRFLGLEKRLMSNHSLKIQYSQFMTEYKDMNHMSLLKGVKDDDLSYYLPHHAVLRSDSLTSKIRVVFNGSALSDTGVSLNDLQYVGPPILNDIFDIMIRFRQHNIVVASDIEKMYRQVSVDEKDRHLQRIIWRDNPSEALTVYSLNTVVYGTTSAPFLAMRCLKQLSLEYKEKYPVASLTIDRDFYVDDLITGFSNEKEAVEICHQISSILQSAQFPLRKWKSNNAGVLSKFKNDSDDIAVLRLGDNEQSKTLGVFWTCGTDRISFQILQSKPSLCSKRHILSELAKVYDPLGLLSPCIIVAKLIIQKLWALKQDWDSEVPSEIKQNWQVLRKNLLLFNEFNIPRQFICKDPSSVELHCFSDASQTAYSSCIYVRSCSVNCTIHVHLACAKTKVAPLKSQTIPRLELCGALTLARLSQRILKAISVSPKPVCHFWTDSQIVLCWLRTAPNLLQTFVSHRVAEIQQLTDVENWRHVNSKDNPADLASRGVLPEVLINSELWWRGPSWLSQPEHEWPNSSFSSVNVPEIKNSTKIFVTTSSENMIELFRKFSSFNKLKRVVGYVFRFITNLKLNPDQRLTGSLNSSELRQATFNLIKLSQAYSFRSEIDFLMSNRCLHPKSKLLKLTPFLDNDNILRVGGRLADSNLLYSAKHPILLHGKHPLTKLIFESEHIRLLHAGPQTMLNAIRQTYWPIAGLNLAKRVVHECVTCFKCKPKPIFNIMGNLPKQRVTATNPFEVTGVDYAGPFLLKDRKTRGYKITKAYVCLFICFSIKAIHLDLVSDLTSDCFVAALRRFCARRGFPKQIWSDNGTNFHGAVKKLTELQMFFKKNTDKIVQTCAENYIDWKFIPASAPHFGGLWESGIKSTKYHLLRVINSTKLTYEEFLTVLTQIEATLNSRPLFPVSSDPNDIFPLTPAHFIIGRPLVMVPDAPVTDLPVNRLSRYQLLQQIHQSFWKRWSQDYLNSCQQRTKWKEVMKSVPIDTLVLIKHDHLPPGQWLLGRICAVHPGNDGIVRVVSVETKHGIFKRPITKVCPFPTTESSPTN